MRPRPAGERSDAAVSSSQRARPAPPRSCLCSGEPARRPREPARPALLVADTAEAVLPTVEARMATPLAGRVRLVLVPADQAPGPCEPRAAALPTRRRIVLFAGPATLDAKALPAFLAHEIGHQL